MKIISDNKEFGFKSGDLEVIVRQIAEFPDILEAKIFGSRAKGNYNTGSDVDIAIISKNDNDYSRLAGVLNDETPLPYFFDVIDYNRINSQALKEEIDQYGKIIFYK